MNREDDIKSVLLDKLLECTHKLELKGYRLVSKPLFVSSKAFMDVYSGLYTEDRNFKVEVWVHAVKEREDTYLYAVMFIASKFKTSDKLLPAIRAEIARWDSRPSDFPGAIASIISTIANSFSKLEKTRCYIRLKDLEKVVEENVGLKTRISYMKLGEKWFEEHDV